MISAEDLTARLLRAGVGSGPVTVVETAPIGNGVMAQAVRVALAWAGDGPASVVVKTASSDPGSLAMATALRMYEVEVGFYRDIAPLLPGQIGRAHV